MWQRTSGPSRTLDLVSCHWCPLEMPLSLLLCCPFPADEGHQEGRVGSVSQSGMCSFQATWSPLHLCQPFSSPRGGGSMMCWDVLQDFLVGSKAEGGRGGQGLPVEPPGSPATVCPRSLLLFPAHPTRRHNLAQAEPGQLWCAFYFLLRKGSCSG